MLSSWNKIRSQRPFLPGSPNTPLARRAVEAVVTTDAERLRLEQTNRQYAESGLTDYWFADDPRQADPDTVMPRLRWGGQFVFITHSPRAAAAVHEQYRNRPEFAIERPPSLLPTPGLASRLGLKTVLLIARKVLLDRPDRLIDRQSFDVRLVPGKAPDEWVVSKRIPSMEQTLERLDILLPNRDPLYHQRLASKLITKVFPQLLTRETGFLRELQHRLPENLRDRVPTARYVVRDMQSLVQRLDITWLRQGGEPISPITFAIQSAQLLDAVHTHAGIVHLDLRLDNMVITERGVGFVDFGSACLINEDLADRPMLHSLYSSMLSASRIRRDLRRLQHKRLVTSSLFEDCYPKRDPAIDLFALALQMTRPCANPTFKGLVYQNGVEGQLERLARLQRHTLRPRDPANPEINNPAQLAHTLHGRPPKRVAALEPTDLTPDQQQELDAQLIY